MRLLLCLAILSLASPHTATAAGCGWRLTFSDDFNGTQLDTQKWDTYYPTYDREAQAYVADAFIVQNGILSIRADKRNMGGYNYTSGILTTYGSFAQKYGRFVIRAKVPKGKGLWPAFWLLPPPRGTSLPESDVFEFLGHEPYTIYMSNHWAENGVEVKQTTYYKDGPDYTLDFHTFELVWSPSALNWYIDGVLRRSTSRGVPAVPMVLLANLAVGGPTSWPGEPDANTPFPSYYRIDYIRVYRSDCPVFLPAVEHGPI